MYLIYIHIQVLCIIFTLKRLEWTIKQPLDISILLKTLTEPTRSMQ